MIHRARTGIRKEVHIMNKTINEIMNNYTSGKTPVEDTNPALKEAGAGFHFVPGQNTLTPEEIAATHVGPRPNDATGYGLMSSGTGTMDKVHVVKGKLQGGAINMVGSDGMPNECDIVYIGGQVWQVYGDELGNLALEKAPWWASMHTFAGAVAWQEEIDKYIPEQDMVYNRPKYHGQNVVKGALRYLYAEDGTCKYQPKSMADYDKDHGRV